MFFFSVPCPSPDPPLSMQQKNIGTHIVKTSLAYRRFGGHIFVPALFKDNRFGLRPSEWHRSNQLRVAVPECMCDCTLLALCTRALHFCCLF